MKDEDASKSSKIVKRLLDEKELDGVFGGGGVATAEADSFELRCDYPPGYGPGGGAFWQRIE